MITTIDLRFLGIPNSIAAYLIETEAGPILIETGPHSTLHHLEVGLAEKGYTTKDIQHVFLTHIHLDHAGCAWHFAQQGAKIYVHPKGYRHLASPEKLMASAAMIYKDKMDQLWGQMNPIADTQLEAMEDLQIVEIGGVKLQAHYTPGHAVHHIAWQVGAALFAGDVAGVKISNGPVMPPCPPPDIHVEDWLTSISRMKKLDLEELYLTHYGKVSNTLAHLESLEQVIRDWADWIKPHYDAQTEQQLVVPQFQKYVVENLKGAGVDEKGLAQYEAANPAWMSVAGLYRYWKIKNRVKTE